jgi:protein ImuB
MNTRQLWLCLRLHTLALDIVHRTLPAAHCEGAIAIQAQQRILQPNDAAQALGIQCGMTTNAARALVPDILLIKHDQSREQKALAALAQHCYRFTPAVVIKAPDCLLLEIKGCLRLFGGLQSLLGQVTDSVETLGFHVQAGLGHTPLASQLLSHGAALHADHALLQRTEFHIDDFLPPLEAVPLSLAIDDVKLCQRLQRLGWRQLGDVLLQPTTALGKGTGKPLLTLLRKITGDEPDPQTPIQPRADFRDDMHLPFALGSVQALLYPAERLLQDMQQFLLRRQLTSHGIEWRLRDTRRRIYSLSITVSKPQYRATVFLALTQLKMESLKLEDDIEVITLISKKHSPLAPPDAQLFRGLRAAGAIDNIETMDELIDRLRARLGDEACQQLRTFDEVLPEMATQVLQLHGDNDDIDAASDKLISESVEQPLWLLPAPQLLPQGLNYRGTLNLVSGPQRLQSYWWNTVVQRDYYSAQHDDGTRYWVYRQLPDGPWYLHGIFS